MAFSLTGIIKYLDTCEESKVMDAVARQYETVSDRRSIFDENFIPFIDLAPLGYNGLKTMLIALYQTDPEFVEQNRHELYNITRFLKGEQDG